LRVVIIRHGFYMHTLLQEMKKVGFKMTGSFVKFRNTYYDLFRVENGFIAEHWDVMETLADKDTWQNQNGKF